MERTLITWSVPNMLTIWLMLIALIVFYTLVMQVFRRATGMAGNTNSTANNAGGY